jgi:hypothetical protein
MNLDRSRLAISPNMNLIVQTFDNYETAKLYSFVLERAGYRVDFYRESSHRWVVSGTKVPLTRSRSAVG